MKRPKNCLIQFLERKTEEHFQRKKKSGLKIKALAFLDQKGHGMPVMMTKTNPTSQLITEPQSTNEKKYY